MQDQQDQHYYTYLQTSIYGSSVDYINAAPKDYSERRGGQRQGSVKHSSELVKRAKALRVALLTHAQIQEQLTLEFTQTVPMPTLVKWLKRETRHSAVVDRLTDYETVLAIKERAEFSTNKHTHPARTYEQPRDMYNRFVKR